MMPKIVSKLHNLHVLKITPETKTKKTLGEFWCGTSQRPSEN